MTYFEIYNAKEALSKLYKLSFENFKTSWQVHKLASDFDEAISFLANEIEKLKEKYGNPEVGKDSKKKIDRLEDDIRKILEMEVDPSSNLFKAKKIKLSIEDIQNAYIPGKEETRLTAEDIVLLSPFIEIINRK